jgi:erythromycin esterase
MKKRNKRLLISGLLVAGLIAMIIWASGTLSTHSLYLYAFFSKPVELSEDEKAEVHGWLQDNAIHLRTLKAGSGFEDMMPLKAMIGDARIVSLGEESHLNRSFSRAKHRMIEFLVEEMDFNVFAIEANFGGALELNDYILGGEGDPRRALGALVYPAWTTESILDMIIWLREHNSTHEKKIKFYGFDDKPAASSARAVFNYLEKTNGTAAYDDILSVLLNLWTAGQLYKGPREDLQAAINEVKGLIGYLENNQPQESEEVLPEKGIREMNEWSLALQHARVLLQNLEFNDCLPNISKASNLRDQHMAQNVRWISEHEQGCKMILWAANAHIAKSPGAQSMGAHLDQAFGEDQVVIALLSNRKSEESFDVDETPETSDEIPPTIGGTLIGTLTEAGLRMAVIDFNNLPDGIVGRYFRSPILEGGFKAFYTLAYDGVLFIESTSNSRFIMDWTPGEPPAIPARSNLGFEEIEDGGLKDWGIQGGQSLLEYETGQTEDNPYSGSACGMIKRIPGKPFGEIFGNLRQSIRADQFRGQSVRFTAAARVTEGVGYLWLSIDVRQGGVDDIFLQREISSEQWQEYSLEAEVPEKAWKISYGLAFYGKGAGYIDNVSIEQVE